MGHCKKKESLAQMGYLYIASKPFPLLRYSILTLQCYNMGEHWCLCIVLNFVLCTYLFIFGCAWSLLLHRAFLQSPRLGAILQLQCTGFLLQWLLLLRNRDSRVCVAPGLQNIAVVAPSPLALSPSQHQGLFH